MADETIMYLCNAIWRKTRLSHGSSLVLKSLHIHFPQFLLINFTWLPWSFHASLPLSNSSSSLESKALLGSLQDLKLSPHSSRMYMIHGFLGMVLKAMSMGLRPALFSTLGSAPFIKSMLRISVALLLSFPSYLCYQKRSHQGKPMFIHGHKK